MNNLPTLFIVDRLLKPLHLAEERVQTIRNELASVKDGTLAYRGLFVVMVGAFEVMMTDMLKYFYRKFPQKFNKEVKVDKDSVLEATLALDLIDAAIDKSIVDMSYGRFQEVARQFFQTLEIDKPAVEDALISSLLEIRETRNLLLHNDLVVNWLYVERAGQLARKKEGILEIEREYFLRSLDAVDEFLAEIKTRCERKWGAFVKRRAIRSLWDYLFSSPLLDFDDYWEEHGDGISLRKTGIDDRLSSSEQILLGLWLAHYNSAHSDYLKKFSMRSLDSSNRKKLLFFLGAIEEFSLY